MVKNLNERDRLDYIDILKGIAIILVLLGHRGFSSYVTQTIYLFHMPLFFFISGYLDKMETGSIGSICIIAKKKAKRLIYPYVVFGILIIIYNTLFDFLRGAAEGTKLLKRLIAFLYGNYIWENNIEYIGVLWFLVCLFFSAMIANIVYRVSSKGSGVKLICIILLMIAGGICSHIKTRFNYRLPWCIDVAFIGAIFYLAGFYWRQWKRKDQYETFLAGCGFLVIGLILGISNLLYMKSNNYEQVKSDMLLMSYGILPIFIASALFISVGLMVIIKKFCEKCHFNMLGHIGQLSLLIMIDHLYVNQIFDVILNSIKFNHWVIFFPITLLVSVLLAEITYRYTPVLFDFKKLPFTQ